MSLDNTVLFLIGQFITSAAIWGAIRSDIINMRTRIEDVKQTADYAHMRIDKHIEHIAKHIEHIAK